MMKVTILGAGAFALGLVNVVYKNTKSITIWSAVKDEVDLLNKERSNKKVLDYRIPDEVKVTSDLEEAVKSSDVIVIAVACKFIFSVCQDLKKYYKKQHIVIASKGIEQNSLLFAEQIVKGIIKTKNIAVISGSTFAKDLLCNMPVGLTLGTKCKKTRQEVIKVFESKYVSIVPNSDVLGIEVCGAIKNVMAILSGILHGMGTTDSTKAMFLTKAILDVKTLIKDLGGDEKSILSYAGIGDILLTCTSDNSRNYTLGKMVGENKSKEEIDQYLSNTTVEGVYTLNSIRDLIKSKKIDMPFIDLIYSILYEEKNPNTIFEYLMNR